MTYTKTTLDTAHLGSDDSKLVDHAGMHNKTNTVVNAVQDEIVTVVSDVATKAPAVHLHDGLGRDVSYFGIVPGVDATAHIDNDLIPYLRTNNQGGLIRWGLGTYLVPSFESTRALPQFTNFDGQGKGATIIKLLNGSNPTYFVYNHQSTGVGDPTGKMIRLSNLTLDGNKANQSSGTGWGVYWNAPTPGAEPAADYGPDSHNLLFNVDIRNVRGGAWGNAGGSENRCKYVWVRNADGHSFVPSWDTWLEDCTSDGAGLNGFQCLAGSVRIKNCKAFYSGRLTVDGGSGGGNGLYAGDPGDSGALSISNFEAQDNGGHGVALYNTRWVNISNLACDSNGWGKAGALAAPGTYMGLDMYDCWYCTVVNYMSYDRKVDHGAGARVTQSNALRPRGSTPRGHIKVVNGMHAGMPTNGSYDGSMGAAIVSNDTTNVPASSFDFNNTVTTNP